jgi:hypothetical protein
MDARGERHRICEVFVEQCTVTCVTYTLHCIKGTERSKGVRRKGNGGKERGKGV